MSFFSPQPSALSPQPSALGPGPWATHYLRAHFHALCDFAAVGQNDRRPNVSTPLRIGIVEDDAQLLADFTRLVSDADGMTCVGDFASAEHALAAAAMVLMC